MARNTKSKNNKRQASMRVGVGKQQGTSFLIHPQCALRQRDRLKKADRKGLEGWLDLSTMVLDDEQVQQLCRLLLGCDEARG